MEKYIYYMENNIADIMIDETHLPLVADCNILSASESFCHMDRTAQFNVLILVTDGAMYVTENGVDYEITAGELLFLKSGLRHFGKYETLRGTRWVYVHFYLPDEGNEFEKVAVPKKSVGLSGTLTEEKLYTLCNTFHSAQRIQRLRSNALFYDILLDLCSERQLKDESISDQICAFLDNQTDKNFSKELISSHFYLSYSRLAAEFKKEKGVSMGEYHNAARMKRACQLLRSTLMTVGEAADTLGFSDMLYFSKKFRAFVGLSPTEYRKLIQNRY